MQYKQLNLNKIKINISVENESYILTKKGKVVKYLNIVQLENEIVLIGKIFEKNTMLYKKPVDSKIFDIFIVDNISNSLKSWNISELKKKVMLIIHDGISIAMPILHT